MEEKKLSSGAVISLQIAAFDDSVSLLDELLLELVGVPLAGFSPEKLEELFGEDITALKDAIFRLIASKKVRAVLFICMGSCKYQGPRESIATRITKDTFEKEENRADFLPVAMEVATLNVRPFFRNLEFSSLIGKKETPAADGRASPTG